VGALARAHLLLAQALEHSGRRSEAIASYRAALDAIPSGDPDRVAQAARAALRGR
jgi:DNA-binding GntR family transcriptional regulator